MTNTNAPLLSLLFFALVHPTLADDGYLPNGSMTQGQELLAGWRPATGEEGSGIASAARDTQVFKMTSSTVDSGLAKLH